jgi:glycine/D-amino acid oxidase-like deaminating enzyme
MATRITGRCVWLREAIEPGEEDEPPLRRRAARRRCYVGGGYTGLWTALEIKSRQPALAVEIVAVEIVEADICGGGASGRNTGMVLPQWVKFEALRQLCGTEGALQIADASERVLDEIESFSAEQGIDAEFRRDGWLWGATCDRQIGSWAGVVAAGSTPFAR